jgi:flagellar protein FliS
MNNQLKTYQQMHISGLNQQELIVLLYSGALRFIEDGKDLLKTKDVPRIHEKLDKARNIFIHLLATLNMEKGGELAQKLSALYAFFIEKITVANVTKSATELDEIIPLIKEIKESWEKIDIKDQTIPENLKTSNAKPTRVFSAEV